MINTKKYSFRKILLAYILIILISLTVILSSLFVFAFSLANQFKGLNSVFIFLVIPFSYFLVLLYANKKIKKVYNLVNPNVQFRFDLVKQILWYVIIMLLAFFIFLISLYFPMESKGINLTPLNLTIQPYLLSNDLSHYNETNFLISNKIYSEYNITLHLNPPKELKIDINNSLIKLILQQNCSTIDYVYDNLDKENKTIKLVFIDLNSSLEGMANICGKGDLIIMSLKPSIAPGWILSHETGHVLSAKVACWKFNLMKEYSRECFAANWITHDYIRDLQPDFLNQKQVNSMVNTIKNNF